MGIILRHVASNPAIVVVEGAIDLAHASILDRELQELRRRGELHVTLDLANVRYVSSSGLGVLVKAAVDLDERGGGLALLGVTEKVRIVIEMLGIEQVFSVVCKERPLAATSAGPV